MEKLRKARVWGGGVGGEGLSAAFPQLFRSFSTVVPSVPNVLSVPSDANVPSVPSVPQSFRSLYAVFPQSFHTMGYPLVDDDFLDIP